MAELAMGEYLSTVRSLWPSGSDPHLACSLSIREETHQLLVIPSRRNPRLLVPAANRRAAAAAMMRFSAALTPGDTAKRLAMAACLRFGATGWLPDRIAVPNVEHSLAQYLGHAVFHQDVELSLGLGSARANRKPVLQVFDLKGRSVAFVKLGISDRGQADVVGEAEALRRLAGAGTIPGVHVPELLHDGYWGGIRVIAMSSLNTSLWQRPARDPHPPTGAMRAVHDAFHEGCRPLTESPLWWRLQRAAVQVQDDEARDRLGRALARLADVSGTRLLPVGAWHGDWTPWNMAKRGRVAQVWDWERFETGVPHGLDVCHYGVNTLTRREGISKESVRAGLASVGLGRSRPDAQDAVVAGIYLAAITCRYLMSAQGELGERITHASLVMLDTLCSWVDTSSN